MRTRLSDLGPRPDRVKGSPCRWRTLSLENQLLRLGHVACVALPMSPGFHQELGGAACVIGTTGALDSAPHVPPSGYSSFERSSRVRLHSRSGALSRPTFGLHHGREQLGSVVRWRPVCVYDEVLVAFVDGLQRGSSLNVNNPPGANIVALSRLTEMHREAAGENNEGFLLLGVHMALTARARLRSEE